MNSLTDRKRQQGFSMIEVLVGTLLISFSLLGLVALQSRTMQLSSEAEDSQRASLMAAELASEMWASDTLGVSADILKAWQDKVADQTASGLPEGVGTLTVAGSTAVITIEWMPPRSGGVASRYTTEVVIPVEPT